MSVPWAKIRRLGAFGIIVSLVGGIGASILGYVVQTREDAAILERNPPPGEFVTIEGRNFHFRVHGSARESGGAEDSGDAADSGAVTFVMETGLGEYSGSWGPVEDSLALLGRVFLYDRAGYGWSDAGPEPRTIQRLETELAAVLRAAEIRRPVILVGHSLGGAVATLHALRHPGEVAGLLLIDPSHPDMLDSLPMPPAWQVFALKHLPRTAPIGLAGRIMGPSDEVKRRSTHIETFGAEFRALFESVEAWEEPIEFGALPIIVLTRGPGRNPDDDGWHAWRSLHESLVAASTHPSRRHLVVEGAGHYIHVDDPGAVARAARELTAAAGR